MVLGLGLGLVQQNQGQKKNDKVEDDKSHV